MTTVWDPAGAFRALATVALAGPEADPETSVLEAGGRIGSAAAPADRRSEAQRRGEPHACSEQGGPSLTEKQESETRARGCFLRSDGASSGPRDYSQMRCPPSPTGSTPAA